MDIRRLMPYVEIIEQPISNATRFLYEWETRSHAPIRGVNSTEENITYPTI
jgi:hypothetical protein